MSDSVEGASVAPATPSSARAAMSIAALRRERREHRRGAERRGADQQEPPPADAVAERAHRDERAGDEEAVDVDDPEQLRARSGFRSALSAGTARFRTVRSIE